MRGSDAQNNKGPLSNMVSYVSAGAPSFPTNTRPTITKIGATDIEVKWSAPQDRGSPVLGFVVMQDINQANNWQVLYNGT